MSDEAPIDIFAAMRNYKPKNSKNGKRYLSRATVQFTVPEIYFDLNSRKAARGFAEMLAARAKFLLQNGQTLSGAPMPNAAPATIERRRYREQQAARGGFAHPRYRDDRFRARAIRRYRERFVAPRLGQFTPRAGNLFGTESGMLAASPAVKAETHGRFVMFFATSRAVTDRKGTSSAVQRVFSRVGIWSEAAMREPGIQDGLRQLMRSLVVHRFGRIANELIRIAQNVNTTLDKVEDIADAEAI